MSLHEAVLEIAKDMEDNSSEEAWQVQGWAKQLRMVVKAAGMPLDTEAIGKAVLKAYLDTPLPSPNEVLRRNAQPLTPELNLIEKLKVDKERRDKGILAEQVKQDAAGSAMTECVNGGLHGTFVEIDPKMPTGAKTLFGAEVYWLNTDGKLHYSQEETKKFLEDKKKASGLAS